MAKHKYPPHLLGAMEMMRDRLTQLGYNATAAQIQNALYLWCFEDDAIKQGKSNAKKEKAKPKKSTAKSNRKRPSDAEI